MLDHSLLLPTREITIENTTFCGAHCTMCPRDEYSHRWQYMEMDVFKKSIDEAAELGAISWDSCGFGDPLMDRHLEERLVYVKTKYPQMKIYTSTTAHLLDKRMHLIHYFDTMKISHYGFTKETYERIHQGKLEFEKVKENILKFFELPRNKRPYTIMLFLVQDGNEHELEDWKKFWAPYPDELLVWKLHNYSGSINSHIEKEGEARTCGRPFNGNYFIHASGEVSPCCFDYNKKLLIGDIRKESLKDILTGEKLNHIKKVHNEKSFKGSGLLCEGCDQIYCRDNALVYASNENRTAGMITTHPDMVNKIDQVVTQEA